LKPQTEKGEKTDSGILKWSIKMHQDYLDRSPTSLLLN